MAIPPSSPVPVAAASYSPVQTDQDQKKSASHSAFPPRSWRVLKEALKKIEGASSQEAALNEFQQLSINYNKLSREGDRFLRALFDALISEGAVNAEKVVFSYGDRPYSGQLIDQLTDDAEHAPLVDIYDVEDRSRYLRLDLKLGKFEGCPEYFSEESRSRKRRWHPGFKNEPNVEGSSKAAHLSAADATAPAVKNSSKAAGSSTAENMREAMEDREDPWFAIDDEGSLGVSVGEGSGDGSGSFR